MIDSFALELRAESIEQLCGGDALRCGEYERIETGRSDRNSDLVAGCDRVQVQDSLAEHTGHGLAVQAAHLDTTVGGSFDTWAGKEDTVLLAGHMGDTWNGGTVTVAAMTDDTAGGGGVRATAPLDVWVHGLMGLEERPGTCTADGVLAEACGTLYEREYRSAVHAAGLGVFNGTLYQSVRTSFRPLMRISMGVRNLIAGGGGGSGDDAPPASPPPAAGEAGAQGAEAASATLAAARGTVETSQSAHEAAHLDLTGVLTREAGEGGIVAVSDDLSELRPGTDTAERLGGLRDALRGAEAGGETASGARTSSTGASGALAVDPPGFLDGRPAAVALDPVPPAPQVGDPQFRGGPSKLGLLGGGPGDPPQPLPDDFDWAAVHRSLNERRSIYVRGYNWTAVDAYKQAIAVIDARVIETYVEFGGDVDDLARRATDGAVVEEAYRTLRRLARRADQAGAFHSDDAIGQALEIVDRLTYETAGELTARAVEFESARLAKMLGGRLDPGIDLQKLDRWAQDQIVDGARKHEEAHARGDFDAMYVAWEERSLAETVRDQLAVGTDPQVEHYDRIRNYVEIGHTAWIEEMVSSNGRLMDAMIESSMRPAESSGGVRRPFHASDGVASGRLLDPPDTRDPAPVSSASGSSLSVNAGGTVTPWLGTESVSWLRPAEPARAQSTAQFDSGLRRAGEWREGFPQGLGEAASGGGASDDVQAVLEPGISGLGLTVADTRRIGVTDEAGRFLRASESSVEFDPRFIDATPSWARDAFAVERALIAGRLPPGFDASRLNREWGWLAKDTSFANHLQQGVLPTPAIDSMIASHEAMNQRGQFTLLIGHLREMKASIAVALESAHGYRVDADWLAKVDGFLQTRRAGQEVTGMSIPGARHSGDVIVQLGGAAEARTPPTPLDAAAHPRRTGASSGAVASVDEEWRGPPPGMPGGRQPARFVDGQTVGAGDASHSATRSDSPQGWQSVPTPGFGRLASGSGEFPFSCREQMVHRLTAGEALSQTHVSELFRRFDQATGVGASGSSAAQPSPVAALIRDLGRLRDAARESLEAAAGLEEIDWSAIDLLLRVQDVSGRTA